MKDLPANAENKQALIFQAGKLAAIDTTRATAETALKSLVDKKYDQIISLDFIGLSENAVWKAKTERLGSLALRIQRPGYRQHAATVAELNWLDFLTKHNLAVPQALEFQSCGEKVLRFGGSSGDQLSAVAFKWIDGDAIDLKEAPNFMRQFGEFSARLHNLNYASAIDSSNDSANDSGATSGALARGEWSESTIFGSNATSSPTWGHWGDLATIEQKQRSIFQAAEILLCQRLAALGRSSDVFALVHADSWATNWLTTKVGADAGKDSRALALIDFDDCAFSWYLFDLAGAVSFIEHQKNCRKMVDDWLEGYLALRSLPARLLDEAASMMMLRRFQLLGWMHTRRATSLADDMQASGFIDSSAALASNYLASDGQRLWSRSRGSL